MSQSLTNRLPVRSLLRTARATPTSCPFQSVRSLSQTSARSADDDGNSPPKRRATAILENIYGTSQGSKPAPSSAMASLSQSLIFKTLNKSSVDTSPLSGPGGSPLQAKMDDVEPFHFHILSHKHNTHVTVTKPNREPIISMSTGNIGFRKARRGLYDSAYSLTKYVLERLIHTGWPMKMNRIEVVLRGFGQGREAAVKVLMSPEGKLLRDKIVRVADSSRIKFGGTRSEKPRRL